jgi:hypothetical protein
MSKILFANNAMTQLTAAVTTSSTTLAVTNGSVAYFPSITAGSGDYFMLCVTDELGTFELMKCTGVSGNNFTVVRAQEGTVAKAFAKGCSVENRLTAGTLADGLLQVSDLPTSVTPAANAIPKAGPDGKLDPAWVDTFSMPIGTIFSHTCSSTFTPNGCLPVDGAEYTKAQFSDFYTNYLASGKLLTCTYAQYSTAVSTYGACAKFALDTTNQKFKVPLIPDGESITQALSNSQLGVGLNAGLPNINGHFTGVLWSTDDVGLEDGAFKSSDHTQFTFDNGQYTGRSVAFDASRSNSIYGNSTTVQPPQVRLRHFVVVANGTIIQSVMDWSAWATGLAGKANTDLSNCTKPYITEYWANSDQSKWYIKLSNGVIRQGGYYLPVSSLGTVITISFPVPFTTTTYTLVGTPLSSNNSATDGEYSYKSIGYNKTRTGFSAKPATDSYVQTYNWIAEGK